MAGADVLRAGERWRCSRTRMTSQQQSLARPRRGHACRYASRIVVTVVRRSIDRLATRSFGVLRRPNGRAMARPSPGGDEAVRLALQRGTGDDARCARVGRCRTESVMLKRIVTGLAPTLRDSLRQEPGFDQPAGPRRRKRLTARADVQCRHSTAVGTIDHGARRPGLNTTHGDASLHQRAARLLFVLLAAFLWGLGRSDRNHPRLPVSWMRLPQPRLAAGAPILLAAYRIRCKASGSLQFFPCDLALLLLAGATLSISQAVVATRRGLGVAIATWSPSAPVLVSPRLVRPYCASG